MKIHFFLFLILIQCFASCQQTPEDAQSSAANIIFKSADGGQTWQDVSARLPENLQIGSVFGSGSYVFLGTQNGFYHSNTAIAVPVWQKDLSLNEAIGGVFPSRTGLYALTDIHGFFQQTQGTGVWHPVFADMKNKMTCTILETLNGTILVGCRNGIFKSTDQGKTWKQVFNDGWVMKIVESEGVLICTNEHGILRSTDGGEQWDLVISEGGVGISAECIEGGFAAITFNTKSETRRIRISTDGGKTWQPIDADLPPNLSITSIKQVGKSFFCGHPAGIFRSDNHGKNWQRILPSIGEKVFNLYVLDGVIYAVPRNAGC